MIVSSREARVGNGLSKMKIKVIKYIKRLFCKNAELMDIFANDNFQMSISERDYPPFISLAKQQIYAVYAIFVCSDQKLSLIKENIADIFSVDATQIIQQGVISDGLVLARCGYRDAMAISNKKVLTYSFEKDFNNNLVRVVTNSAEFVHAVKTLPVSPPLPWDAFPSLRPQGYGSLQGRLAFWWENIWRPFWHNLAPDEKDAFLMQYDVSEEWREFIFCHP
ncbi:hypothetical protein AAFL31_28655 [Klebsiella huaxiensis]|uniref:hypothetical protein n=1 Tax=Klebsiella TaxID=570 RepID=UPI002590229A|nr:hypothetical protein [Klebsiella sp.]